MQLRPFGDTGMHVSEIGLGAWQLANPDWHADDPRAAHQIVARRHGRTSSAAWLTTAPASTCARCCVTARLVSCTQ